MIVVATTKTNEDALAITTLQSHLIKILEERLNRVEEESIKDNYVLVYEVLDEIVDGGIVQITDSKLLSKVITQKGFKLSSFVDEEQSNVEVRQTSSLSWRPEGIRHKKNEVYLDVIERVNLLAASNGDTISCTVNGEIVAKCYLSGMPELKLGLNERSMLDSRFHGTSPPNDNPSTNQNQNAGGVVDLEDVHFHACVQMSKFEDEKVITFTPPDGEFTLLTYRCDSVDQRPLLWCECVVERETLSSLELFVRVRSSFKRKSAANNVVINIPVPDDIYTPRLKATIGGAKYKPELGVIQWKIGYFPGGGKEFSLQIKVGRPIERPQSGSAEDVFGVKRPISIAFELPYFTLSGLQVRYLKIQERSGYQALPWVRYITRNGQYNVRMPDK